MAPIPPSCMVALVLLYTSAPLIKSVESTSKLNSRPPLSLATWRPFTRTLLNWGPRPRTVTACPSPPLRSIDTPVIRCNDSATFKSGNLPASSAEIESTTVFASRLISRERVKLARIPVTVISSIAPGEFSCATTTCAVLATTADAAITLRTAKATLLNVNMCFSSNIIISYIPANNPRHTRQLN